MNKKLRDYRVVRKWIEDMSVVIRRSHPHLTDEEIDSALENIVVTRLKNMESTLENNHTKTSYNTNILELTEFISNNNLTTAGNGVLFDRDGMNPATPMLDKMKKVRGFFKKRRDKSKKGTKAYISDNLKQSNEKKKMNSWYGITGSRVSLFFNLFCATATTGKGQLLIGVATTAFEAFLSDNISFLDLNECMVYIKNIVSEDTNFVDEVVLDQDISLEQVLYRLRDNMENEVDFNEPRVRQVLRGCSQKELNRIYYKNNLYEFCSNKYIRSMLHLIFHSIDAYNDPSLDAGENILPKYFKDMLDNLWNHLSEFVFYNHEITEKIYRIKNQKRKSIIVIDTDSNMVYLKPWMEFCKKYVLSKNEYDKRTTECENFDNIMAFTLCYNLSKMMRARLWKYLGNCNVKKKERPRLDMKNEYYYSRMCVTESKKSYAGKVLYQEGNPVPDEESLDIKGLAIKKADTNRNVSAIFQKILKKDILEAENIDVVAIVRQLNELEMHITDSMLGLSKEFLKPAKFNEPEKYADPYSEQPFRAYLTWNAVYPDNPIVLPDNFNIIKIKLTKVDDLDNIPDKYAVEKENLRQNIFNNPDERISKKGAYVIAIPQQEDVPEWVSHVMDIHTVVSDTMKAFSPISKCVGIVELNDGDIKSQSPFISL